MKYFTMTELTSSATARRKGIDNTPSGTEKAALTAKLNRAVGGAPKSQHVAGEAADIRSLSDFPSENKRLFDLIVRLKLPFDQLIDEYDYNWVHVSYSIRNRREVLHVK